MTKAEIINSLIKKFNYYSYLEIGIQKGVNYIQIDCLDKIGVDPDPKCMLNGMATMTSDEFFKHNKKGFDVILVDGLHHSDQVYRDIVNSLRFLNKGGTIVCHDMNPTDKEMQEVPRKVKVWTGDCWKAWVGLKIVGVEKFVVDTDFGVGVIRPIGDMQIDYCDTLQYFTYEYLDENRKELLNLITVQEFKNWLGC
jgi:hypothetical protein